LAFDGATVVVVVVDIFFGSCLVQQGASQSIDYTIFLDNN